MYLIICLVLVYTVLVYRLYFHESLAAISTIMAYASLTCMCCMLPCVSMQFDERIRLIHEISSVARTSADQRTDYQRNILTSLINHVTANNGEVLLQWILSMCRTIPSQDMAAGEMDGRTMVMDMSTKISTNIAPILDGVINACLPATDDRKIVPTNHINTRNAWHNLPSVSNTVTQ